MKSKIHELQKNNFKIVSKTTFLIGLFAFATVACAQNKIKGNGNVTTKTVTTSAYDKVSVAGFYDVNLVSGKEGSITVEGESNLIDHITIAVEGGTLKIATEKGKSLSTSHGKSIIVTVPFESLEGVSLAGSGDVRTKSPIKATHFQTTLTGSGDINLDVDAKSIEANVTGSGDMVLKGSADTFNCELTGSGDLTAYDLKSGSVKTSVTGSGDCKVFCSNALEARVSGSGDIQYKGDPKTKDTKVSGSGSISKA
ncbi:head GIN domain-containing protein [Flavobacterium sp.]|uniref:head GIN domain-containing protein n=1 Tax=Flavobacterium sp. TaxID=239 RepID=UPI0039E2977C